MFAPDATTGGFWATDANGNLYPQYGAPEVASLSDHPEYHAGSWASGGANPVVGLVPITDTNGQVGICYVVQLGGMGKNMVPYAFYRFARNGTPD